MSYNEQGFLVLIFETNNTFKLIYKCLLNFELLYVAKHCVIVKFFYLFWRKRLLSETRQKHWFLNVIGDYLDLFNPRVDELISFTSLHDLMNVKF